MGFVRTAVSAPASKNARPACGVPNATASSTSAGTIPDVGPLALITILSPRPFSSPVTRSRDGTVICPPAGRCPSQAPPWRVVPRPRTHGPSGSYRRQSPQGRRAPSLARDPAAPAAALERRAGLDGKPESTAASSGNLRRVSQLSCSRALAEENGSHAGVCALPPGLRDQLGGRERRQTFRVTAVTSKSVGQHYSYPPYRCPSVNDGVGSSSSRCELQPASRRLVPAHQSSGPRRRRRCERDTRRGRPCLPADVEFAASQMDRGAAPPERATLGGPRGVLCRVPGLPRPRSAAEQA